MTAGLAATTTLGGTLFETTAPAATTEFSPMVTPFKMTAFGLGALLLAVQRRV